jgi:hypothetical protein
VDAVLGVSCAVAGWVASACCSFDPPHAASRQTARIPDSDFMKLMNDLPVVNEASRQRHHAGRMRDSEAYPR